MCSETEACVVSAEERKRLVRRFDERQGEAEEVKTEEMEKGKTGEVKMGKRG